MSKYVMVEVEMMRDPNCGIGQFCYQLSKHILAISNDRDIKFLAPSSVKGIIGSRQFKPVEKYFRMKLSSFFQKQPGLWHMTNQDTEYLPVSSRSRVLITIHDLNYIHELTESSKKDAKSAMLQCKLRMADAIAVDSQYVADELMSRFDVKDIPVHVIHLAANDGSEIPDTEPSYIPADEFLFTIGYVHPKKNFHVLVDMIERLPGLNLIIAGSDRKQYADDIRNAVKAKNLDDRVKLVGSIPETEKWWYYRNCKAFVFPSLLEGFGIPVLEAMHCGKPVFLSDLTSLPEVGGSEAYYWSNFDPDYTADIFKKGISEYNEAKQDKIRKWAQKFTWQSTAEKYLKLYDSI